MRFKTVYAGALLAGSLSLLAPSAALADDSTAAKRGIPADAQVARVVDGESPVTEISKSDYLVNAAKAGEILTAADAVAVAQATSCWRWDAWRLGENVWGADLWKSHHRVNWCGDWKWIRNHSFTERWGDTFWVGWNDKGLTQSGSRYGVNWNQYQSWTQRKFCYVEFYSCVQEANPYHSTTVFPNGAGSWN